MRLSTVARQDRGIAKPFGWLFGAWLAIVSPIGGAGGVAAASTPPDQGIAGAIVDGLATGEVTEVALEGKTLTAFMPAEVRDPEFGVVDSVFMAELDLSKMTPELLESMGVNEQEFGQVIAALPPGGRVVAVSDDEGTVLVLLGLDTELVFPDDIIIDSRGEHGDGSTFLDLLEFLLDLIARSQAGDPATNPTEPEEEDPGNDPGW